MKSYMEYFREICAIPHGSFETDELREYLLKHCEKTGFKARVDAAGNIHAIKGEPRICLQSHYDMVCVGDAPDIKLVEKDGFLMAKNSSLGADNGIGVAMMMVMMDRYTDFEVVFTNNEEVGLWGVARFDGEIKSPNLLNLDSEEDFRVSIGCAGSVDIYATKELEKAPHGGFLYELVIDSFPGGHSGTQIHENIPNSIKFMARFIKENGGKIVKFDGGERRNSIAANAKVEALFDEKLGEISEFIKAKFLGEKSEKEAEIYAFSDELLDMLCIFSQGVRAFNTTVNIPEDSINLSTAKEKSVENSGKSHFEVLFFGRSMSSDGLKNLKFETITLAESFGFSVRLENETTPWKPEINEFSTYILECLKKHNPKAKFAAVHAGLECGVFLKQNPNLKVSSIGPNIFAPHSTGERLEIASADMIFKVVDEIVKNA